MVPNEFSKTLCLLAGCVTLVEAVVWGAAAIYSIGVYNCNWAFFGVKEGASSWTLLYVTYFIGECRGPAGADVLGFSLTPANNPARCLLVWMWIYAIVSIIWIPACLLLIGGVLSEVKGRKGVLLYYPWTSLALVFIILDFAAALYHLVDVFQTSIPEDYAKFTASTSWDTFTKSSISSNGVFTWLPSFYLTLFFCRLLVVWLLNIFFFCTVSKASIAVSQYGTEHSQTSTMVKEREENGSDPKEFQNQSTITTISQQTNKFEERKRTFPEEQRSRELIKEDSRLGRQNHPSNSYKTDQFGTPIEEEDMSQLNAAVYGEDKERLSRKAGSPYLSTRIDYTSRPASPDSFGGGEYWHEGPPPPLASSIKIQPELNKIGSFSYTAGDQPQLLSRTNLSRSNSRAERQYPHIPRPDYTIADRRTASLEYVPNRFKIPTPKRPQSIHSTLTYDAQTTTTSHKVAPVPPKKPQVYLRSTPSSRTRYTPQQHPPSQQVFHTPPNNNYNINKLY